VRRLRSTADAVFGLGMGNLTLPASFLRKTWTEPPLRSSIMPSESADQNHQLRHEVALRADVYSNRSGHIQDLCGVTPHFETKGTAKRRGPGVKARRFLFRRRRGVCLRLAVSMAPVLPRAVGQRRSERLPARSDSTARLPRHIPLSVVAATASCG